MTAALDLAGKRLNGFLLVERLGEGGMGVVYRGRPSVGPDRAVKVLRDRELAAKLATAAAVLASLRHPRIVEFVHADLESDPPFLVTELVEGGSVARDVFLDSDRCRAIVQGILEGLAFAHGRGVLHLDLKPSNVLLAEDGPKLADFGLARMTEGGRGLGHSQMTPVREAAGTPAYMAPELHEGSPADARADMYSLGVLLCELLTGKHPQPGDTLHELLNADPPAWAETLFSRCYCRQEKRFASAVEALAALGATPSAQSGPTAGVVAESRESPSALRPQDWEPLDQDVGPEHVAQRCVFAATSCVATVASTDAGADIASIVAEPADPDGWDAVRKRLKKAGKELRLWGREVIGVSRERTVTGDLARGDAGTCFYVHVKRRDGSAESVAIRDPADEVRGLKVSSPADPVRCALACLGCKGTFPLAPCWNCEGEVYLPRVKRGGNAGLICPRCEKWLMEWACPTCATKNPAKKTLLRELRPASDGAGQAERDQLSSTAAGQSPPRSAAGRGLPTFGRSSSDATKLNTTIVVVVLGVIVLVLAWAFTAAK